MKRLLSIILAIICIFSFALPCFAHSERKDANGGHFDRNTGEHHYYSGNFINKTTTESSGIDWEYWKQKAKEKDEEEYQKLVEDYNNRQSYDSFSEYTNEKYGTQESDIWTVKEKTNENQSSNELKGEFKSMTYELFQQGPEVFIPYLIISLLVTLLAYGAFPFIFAKTRKTSITEKKYKQLCYGINIAVLFIFAIINGTFNIAPYILWTWVFSKYGMKVLGTKGLMPDSDYLEDSPVYLNQQETPNAETISYCRNCGNKLFDDSSFCNKCGTKVIYSKTTQDYITSSNVQTKNSELVYGEDIKLNKIKSNSFSDKDYETMLKCISFSIRLYKNEFEKEDDNRTTEEKEEDLETLQSLEELFDVFLSKQKPSLLQNILAIACVRTYFEFIDSQLNNNPSEERKKWLLQQLEEISSVFPKLEPVQRK